MCQVIVMAGSCEYTQPDTPHGLTHILLIRLKSQFYTFNLNEAKRYLGKVEIETMVDFCSGNHFL